MTNISLDSQILTSLMTCPRAGNWRFNESLVKSEGKSNSLECGSLAHVILEHFNKAIISGKGRGDAIACGLESGREYLFPYSPTNKYIVDELHPGVTHTPADNTKDGKTDLLGSNFVFQTMAEYFDFYKNDSHTIIGAEETRGSVIYEDTDLRILWKAKFDEIIDTPLGYMSSDTKTMKQRRESLSLNNQFMGQCVLLKSRNIRINKIGFQKSLKPNEKFERVIISYSNDRLAEWCYEIVPHYARLLLEYSETEYWPPNFNSCEGKYGHCDFKEVCEHDRNMRDEVLRLNFIKTKKWDI